MKAHEEELTHPIPAIALRVGLLLSAVIAALVCAALVFNFIVMPIFVRRGDHVPAPDLVGRSLVEARRVATENGFKVRVDRERPDPEHSAGDVVAQSPSAGLDVKRGRTISLVISIGTDRREIPDLAGLTTRQAQLEAELAGFAVNDVVETYTGRVERGRVVGTDPSAGAIVPAGTGIQMLVSLGPRPRALVMPSLIGKTPEESQLIAEELGLTVRSIKYERTRSRLLRNVVMTQEPIPGARVTEGDAIVLRVGRE